MSASENLYSTPKYGGDLPVTVCDTVAVVWVIVVEKGNIEEVAVDVTYS